MMKKFTHEVVNLRISLHILSKKVIKVYTEQTCVNLCKLRPRFTHICPPMNDSARMEIVCSHRRIPNFESEI
jgi:hypothetical protein